MVLKNFIYLIYGSLVIKIKFGQKLLHKIIPLKKHFPWEHFLAMFAPLLFPLLLPFMISLIRERKRYKSKIKAAKKTD